MKRLTLILLFMTCFCCNKKPQPINYGEDMCNYCQMTIVTKTHAAQMVTDKGKQYKFDAIECMIQFLEDKEGLATSSNLLITNYKIPGKMIGANSACYVISDEISSPMGANLTGFNSVKSAKTTILSQSAEYHDWNSIFNKLTK